MAFKKYPQPPFKKYVLTENGDVLEPNYHTANIEPAVYSKKTGRPLFQFGWTIMYSKRFIDGSGYITFNCKIVKTSDNKEDLE